MTTRARNGQGLATALAEALSDAGTEFLFGIPGGGGNLEVIGAAAEAGLTFVLGHSEGSAAIMAATYAELSGRPGAFLTTRGPGAASSVNGVAHAKLDRLPVLAVTDCVPSSDAPRVTHQYLDQQRLFEPVTKWSSTLSAEEPVETVRHALAVACQQPSGPVHLDVDPEATEALRRPPTPEPLSPADEALLDRARALVERSRRPLFLVGLGARGVVPELRAAIEGSNRPALMTYKAKGVIPDSWPNTGFPFTGASIEAPLLQASDLIIAVGFDPIEAIPGSWSYGAPVLSLTEWAEESLYLEPELEVSGTLRRSLSAIMPHLRDEWKAEAGRSERLSALRRLDIEVRRLSPQDVVLECRDAAPSGTIATVDSGAHMLAVMPLWAAEAPGEALISSGLATMGFALPAAVAASLLHPSRRVICFTGDGGLGMALAELETLARLQLGVVVVVFNDSALSLIEIKQEPTGHGGGGAVRYLMTDFAAVATGFGLEAQVAETRAELRAALSSALTRAGPSLIDARIDSSGYAEMLSALRG